MNYMSAWFSKSSEVMGAMIAELGKRGIGYVDDGSSVRNLASELVLMNGVPFADGDIIIDCVQDRGALLNKLDELESTARAKGFVIGTCNVFDVRVDAVTSWESAASKSFRFGLSRATQSEDKN